MSLESNVESKRAALAASMRHVYKAGEEKLRLAMFEAAMQSLPLPTLILFEQAFHPFASAHPAMGDFLDGQFDCSRGVVER